MALSYAALSLLWSSDPLWGAVLLACLTAGLLLAFFSAEAIWDIFVGFVAFFCVSILFGFAPIEGPNVQGAIIAIGVAGALAYNVFPTITVPFFFATIAFTGSRTSLVAAGIASVIWLWRRNRWLALSAGSAALAVAYVLSVGRSDFSIAQRLGIWNDTGVHLTVWGAGLGSFYEDYWSWPLHVNSTLTRAQHVYNDWLELVYLLGVGTIPLWFFIAGAWGAAGQGDRLVLLTFLVLSMFFFPLWIFPLGTLLVATLVRALVVPLPLARRRLLNAF